MKTIDFLPDIYRQREALRRARVWWLIVVVVFGGAIGSSAGAQAWLKHGLATQFDELTQPYADAQAQVRELSDLQILIAKNAQEASLFTYLQHPWPTTQLLAEITRSLPTAIRLTDVHIGEEELPRPVNQAGPRRHGPEEENAARIPPAEQDLTRLQEDMDYRQTVIELDGQTMEVDSLHHYVSDLSHSPLIATANIKSLETVLDKKDGHTHFVLRLIVRPGYGQRGNESAAPGVPATSVAAGGILQGATAGSSSSAPVPGSATGGGQ
jgi:hypothetical protein